MALEKVVTNKVTNNYPKKKFSRSQGSYVLKKKPQQKLSNLPRLIGSTVFDVEACTTTIQHKVDKCRPPRNKSVEDRGCYEN